LCLTLLLKLINKISIKASINVEVDGIRLDRQAIIRVPV
jgi:hypothetical protein